jgi:hypothetical protein
MKSVIATILILTASAAAADPFSGSAAVPDAPAIVPDVVKEKHPSLPFPLSVQREQDLEQQRAQFADGIKDNTIRADLALALSTLQMDFTQPNYLAGGLAFRDGSTVGAIGWNHRINNRASMGLMIGSNGSDVVVGINGGFGF